VYKRMARDLDISLGGASGAGPSACSTRKGPPGGKGPPGSTCGRWWGRSSCPVGAFGISGAAWRRRSVAMTVPVLTEHRVLLIRIWNSRALGQLLVCSSLLAWRMLLRSAVC